MEKSQRRQIYGSIEDAYADTAIGSGITPSDSPEKKTSMPSQEADFSSRGVTVCSNRSCKLGVAAVSLVILGVALFPGGSPRGQQSVAISGPDRANYFKVPFPSVDRADYGDPVSRFVETHLFHPDLISTGTAHDFKFPFPTGAFWTNLVMPPTADRGLSFPVAVYPYAYKWSDALLQLSYPAAHRKEEPKMIHDYVFPDLTLSAVEDTKERHVVAFDPLSVTLRYTTGSEAYWESYLVQGSPYATIKYQQTSPVIRAFSIFQDVTCPQNESPVNRRLGTSDMCTSETSGMSKILEGVQFVIQSNEGMQWVVFASKPITLVYDQIPKTTVSSKEPFDGVLRIAYIPTSDGKKSSSGIQKLVQHAGTYPVAASLSWSVRSGTKKTFSSFSEQRIGTIQFDFDTKSFASGDSPELLMLALPHHAESLPRSSQLSDSDFDLVYRAIKGPMTPVLGPKWACDQVLPTLGFDGDSGSNSMKPLSDPHVRAVIMENLKKDIILALPSSTENVYGFGKQAARLAQMAHITNMMLLHTGSSTGNATSDTDDLVDLLDRFTDLLSSSLEQFLSGSVSDYFVYDANLGGVVSNDGLLNSEADFGNGRYNDHHFHYGYLLYACAIMGNLNQTFVERYGDQVDSVFFDIANDANLDSSGSDGIFFPFARHKVWFDGHSFASGMFPFGNGKSQESSSEAVNGYYGAYLWSLVRNGFGFHPEADNSPQTDFARLLLATEIRGAKTYWHMSTEESAHRNETKTSIYPSDFAENLMVGNLGMLDAICSTWFGTDNLYVHMINFIPVTSVTGELFSRPFVSEEIAHSLRPVEDIEMAWRGYVVSDTAIVNPMKAWKEAQDLFSPELDSGLSKSQVLYWIATRSDFDPSKVSQAVPEDDASDKTGSGGGGSLCQQNKGCADAGLTGECCPTSEGNFLECCATVPFSGDASPSDDGSCLKNKACADAGLTGNCCPTADGTFLRCCRIG